MPVTKARARALGVVIHHPPAGKPAAGPEALARKAWAVHERSVPGLGSGPSPDRTVAGPAFRAVAGPGPRPQGHEQATRLIPAASAAVAVARVGAAGTMLHI